MASKVAPCPKTKKEFATLSELTDRELLSAGLRPWGPVDDESEDILWLCPGEWHPHIPDGTPLVDIFGVSFRFNAAKNSNDTRGGMAAYGILKPKGAE